MRIFFFILLGFWLFSAILLFAEGYHGSFRLLNQFRNPFVSNASLYFFTHLGDGVILPMVLVIFMWRRDPALVITGVAAMLLTGLVTQLLKNFLFDDWNRPPVIFEGDPMVHIFHPKPAKLHSFPSGHATSIATGGVVFAAFWSQRSGWVQAAVGLFTVALCFTRVIIGVHFPGDIFVGSVIGCLGTVGIMALVYPRLFAWTHKWPVKYRFRVAVTVTIITVLLGVYQYARLLGKL